MLLNIFECEYVLCLFIFLRFLKLGYTIKRLFIFVGIFDTHPAQAPGPISPTPGTPEKREKPGRKGQKKAAIH